MHTCPHCQQPTLFSLEGTQSVHCTNSACNGFYVTLPREQFFSLTPEQLAEYQGGRTSLESLQSGQDEFEARVAAVLAAQAERAANRQAGERLFG